MGTGKVVWVNSNEQEWEPVVPESINHTCGNLHAARSDCAVNAARVKVKHLTSHQSLNLLEWFWRIIEMGQQVAKGTTH